MNQLTENSSSAIVSFPGLGLPLPSGTWKIVVSGFLMSTPTSISLRHRMLLKMLGKLMRASPDDLAGPIFQRRVLPFLSDGDGRRRLTVQLGGMAIRLKKATKKNGQFHESLKIDAADLTPHVETDRNGSLSIPFDVWVEDQPSTRASGLIHLINPTGNSVISDIDDTIKESGVVDRRELLVNTFLKEFRIVDGMADVYRQWQSRGVDFHYVSSSPWQLYEPLIELKNRNQFPIGTVHLKNFRFRDQFFQRMKLKRHGKSTTIRFLAKHLPQRKFVLIGDSGEKDPEIYARICRKFPNQIKAIFIRELPQRPLSDEKRELIGSASKRCVFRAFETAEELAAFGRSLF